MRDQIPVFKGIAEAWGREQGRGTLARTLSCVTGLSEVDITVVEKWR